MTWLVPDSTVHGPGEFARARARAERDTQTLRVRAARTVAGQAINDDDRTRLLCMLGLEGLDDIACATTGHAGPRDLR